MERFFGYFVKNGFLINLATVFLIIIGTLSLLSMNRNLVPAWETKYIRISAVLTGASPEQVEELLTFPMEEAVSSFAGVEEIESSSRASQTLIRIKVRDDFDEIDDLYEKTRNAIDGIRMDLPEDTENISVVTEKMTYFWFCVAHAIGFDPESTEHRLWLKDVVDRIKKAPGIVRVDENSPKPNFYFKLSRESLARYGVSLEDIHRKIRETFQILPLGIIDRSERDVSVEINSDLGDVEDIRNIIVKGNASGTYIRLRDIAEVDYRNDDSLRRSYTNGDRSQRLVLFKDLDSDSLETRREVTGLFERINQEAPEGVVLTMTADGPAYIERQLNVLSTNGLIGIVLVVLSLFLFLGMRSALMTSLGLPLAYFTTFIVLSALGINIDLISVVGMILIVGIIVDDAIIVSEQYSQFLEAGNAPRDAALLAIKKTIAPITGTVLTTIVAFLPILTARDALSDRLQAIPWVVIAALGMSWLESFFILPNHLAHVVKKPPVPRTAFFPTIKGLYARALGRVLRLRYALITGLVAFMGVTVWFAWNHVPMRYQMRVGSERVRVLAVLKESRDFDETERKLAPLFAVMEELDPARYSYINQTLGFAYINGARFEGHRYARMDVRFNQTHPDIQEDKDYVESFLRARLGAVKNDDMELLEIDTRIDGHDEAKDRIINLKVEGRHGVRLSEVFEGAERHYRDIRGFERVFIDPNLSVEKWDFRFDREALSRYDISLREVAAQIRGYVTEDSIHEFRHRGENIKIHVYFEDSEDLAFDELQAIPININEGRSVPLGRLGTWRRLETMQRITHQDLKNVVNIEVSFDESTKKELFQREVERRTPALAREFPSLNLSVEDADEEAVKNKRALNKMVAVALLLILFVLAVVLGSVVQPFLIASAIPFGLIGVVWAFHLHGQSIDVMAFIGIIGMAGVVVNNSLIMVDTVNRLSRGPGGASRATLVEGAASRLRPIILTSITTLGGVFPMAYGIGGDSGFTKPLALALGWGLLCATVLTLFLVPCMLEVQRDAASLGRRALEKFFPRPGRGAL